MRRLRAPLAAGGVLALVLGAQLFPQPQASRAAVTATSAPAPPAAAGPVTVRGPRMLNPATINEETGTAKRFRHFSSVTVSQASNLVNQEIRVSWTGFTPSNNSSSSRPGYSDTSTLYPVMVAECRGHHPTAISQCFGSESGGITGDVLPAGPNNIAFATTTRQGSGYTDLQILTEQQNQWLNCGPDHPCSIAIVPAQGGQNLAPPYDCKSHIADTATPGPATGAGMVPLSRGAPVCSWASRIVVPLSFAPTPKTCPISTGALAILGSPMMQRAMSQWDTALCGQAQPLPLLYDSAVPEPSAVTDVLDGEADIALTTRPASTAKTTTSANGKRTYTYAPVAVTAVSVPYWADNPHTGNPYLQLKLDPQLLLKMLTTSYNLSGVACGHVLSKLCDRSVDGNPANLFADPEFRRLNPGIQAPIGADSLQSVPLVQAGHSDMTYEVTRWINGNAPAQQFLHGQFDAWGMHLNSSYLGLKYPTDAFLPQDATAFVSHSYSPLFPLGLVTNDMLTDTTAVTSAFPDCTVVNGATTCNFDKAPAEPPGERALFAVTDEADADAFRFPVASLLNPAGRYVAPTNASMSAALGSMITSKNGVTQQFKLTSKNPRAYPLTMVVYAMVPTSGVPAAKAALIARWLTFAAGPGQVTGNDPGQLPPGYLPLPGSLRAQTLAAATEVADQSGKPKHRATASPTPSPSLPGGLKSPSPSPSPSVSFPPARPKISTVALRSPQTAGITRYALPALLIVGGLAALGGASSVLATGPWQIIVGRLRRVGAAARRRPRPGRR
jgi:hypothetical protein